MKYKFKNNFKELIDKIEESDYMQTEVAVKLGITSATLNHKLKGRRNFSIPEIVHLFEILGLDLNEITTYILEENQ